MELRPGITLGSRPACGKNKQPSELHAGRAVVSQTTSAGSRKRAEEQTASIFDIRKALPFRGPSSRLAHAPRPTLLRVPLRPRLQSTTGSRITACLTSPRPDHGVQVCPRHGQPAARQATTPKPACTTTATYMWSAAWILDALRRARTVRATAARVPNYDSKCIAFTPRVTLHFSATLERVN